MLYQHQGIILKTYLHPQSKIAVLDSLYGRIDCIPDTHRLCLGGLIQYNVLRQEHYWLVQQVEQVAVPWDLARIDLLFLHHVLEICYFSLAVAARESDVFNFLYLLYGQHNWSMVYKKIFLAKLYQLLHMQPYHCSAILLHLMNSIITESIDTVTHQLLDLNMEKELDRWLRTCMEQHPYRNHFKTTYIYTRMASL